jgi:hypothetical protein
VRTVLTKVVQRGNACVYEHAEEPPPQAGSLLARQPTPAGVSTTVLPLGKTKSFAVEQSLPNSHVEAALAMGQEARARPPARAPAGGRRRGPGPSGPIVRPQRALGLERLVLVVDRGIVTEAKLAAIGEAGYAFITALQARQVRRMLKRGELQLSLFARLRSCRPALGSRRRSLLQTARPRSSAHRTLKGSDLEHRPIHHRLERRVRPHVCSARLLPRMAPARRLARTALRRRATAARR